MKLVFLLCVILRSVFNPIDESSVLADILDIFVRFSNDEEMNIILLRLVEYLGHPNPFICAVAYTEVCVDTHVAAIRWIRDSIDVMV